MHFLCHNYFYWDWYLPPPLWTIGGLLLHWRKTISSTGSTSFSSRLWRECVGGQQALYSILQAASQQTKKHLFNLWKREELDSGQLLHKDRNHRKSASIVWHWEGDGGLKDLSNRGKPHRIFKVIASGSEAVAYVCNYHVHLSIDEGLVMVTLDGFC